VHLPNPESEPRQDDEVDDDVHRPPVPPDQADDVVPVKEPPAPDGNPPKIARRVD
jgi:hypothetical protein